MLMTRGPLCLSGFEGKVAITRTVTHDGLFVERHVHLRGSAGEVPPYCKPAYAFHGCFCCASATEPVAKAITRLWISAALA
jgi:hypothetical protein